MARRARPPAAGARSSLWRWSRQLIGREPDENISAELSALLGDCVLSSGALPLLGMGATCPTA